LKSFLSIVFCLIISLASLPAQAEFNFSTTSPESKPTVAVLVGGQGAIRSNEKAMKLIHEALETEFPKDKYNLVTDSKLVQEILVFAEDEEVIEISQIKKGQLAKFGKERNFDYVVSLVLGLGHGRSGVDFFSVNYDIDVDMQAKVVDVATGQYIYRQNLMGHGKSSAGIGSPSSVNAFAKATKKCMEQFCNEVNISPVKPVVPEVAQ